MITNYFLTKTIAGNEFLSLNGGSFNLSNLSYAEIWERYEEDEEGEDTDTLLFKRIALKFGEKSVYLSLQGDDHHTSGSIYHPHYEMSSEAFQKALEFFGLDEESKPHHHGSYK